jgi:hypothetical protein
MFYRLVGGAHPTRASGTNHPGAIRRHKPCRSHPQARGRVGWALPTTWVWMFFIGKMSEPTQSLSLSIPIGHCPPRGVWMFYRLVGGAHPTRASGTNHPGAIRRRKPCRSHPQARGRVGWALPTTWVWMFFIGKMSESKSLLPSLSISIPIAMAIVADASYRAIIVLRWAPPTTGVWTFSQ